MELRGRVVILTGASSGIGRATARLLGRAGARVVLVARRGDLLEAAADEVRGAGGQALAMPMDVADPGALDRVVQAALDEFGAVDAWVGNAGVAVYGAFEKVPAEEFRRVVEVDFFANVEAARRLLPLLRERPAGHLVFVGAVTSEAAAPLITSYVAANRALLGFAQSLREELHVEGARVHVTTILPESVDTPFYAHARSHLEGDVPRPIPPVIPADRVARAIVATLASDAPPSRRFVGLTGRLLAALSWTLPTTYVRIFARIMSRVQRTRLPPLPPSPGTLFRPTPVGAGVSGGWLRVLRRRRVELGPPRG